MADIESGLKALIETVRHEDIKSIAVPPLGCGNGGLDWSEARPRIESAFKSLADVAVFCTSPKVRRPQRGCDRYSRVMK